MVVTILCPACLQRLKLEALDPLQVTAAGGALCTCAKCKAELRRDDQGRVLTSDGRPCGLAAIRGEWSQAIVHRERSNSVFVRPRGWFSWLFSKRVSVTPEHVDVRLWLRPKIRRRIPLAHARGVLVLQHLWLEPVHSMWGTYLHFEDAWIPLAAFSNLDHAIAHASAINVALIARRPAGDPYRGLLPAVTS